MVVNVCYSTLPVIYVCLEFQIGWGTQKDNRIKRHTLVMALSTTVITLSWALKLGLGWVASLQPTYL